jgi:hypothetical protein
VTCITEVIANQLSQFYKDHTTVYCLWTMLQVRLDNSRFYLPRFILRNATLTSFILLTLLEQPERKHLQRHQPNDLPTRFMV